MNPLLNDYENMILNTNTRVTYNPINFSRYNRNNSILLQPPNEQTDENIHEFKPDIVKQTVRINRKFYGKKRSVPNINVLQFNKFQEPSYQSNSNIYKIKDENEVSKLDNIVEKPIEDILSPPLPKQEKSKMRKYIPSPKKPKSNDIKPIRIDKLDSVSRQRNRKMLIDNRCKVDDRIGVKTGQFLSFPFYNNSVQPMYIYSIDMRVNVSNTNVRGTLYWTDKNPASRKYVLDKTDWHSVRHSIRFFSYNSKVLGYSGGDIHIELNELKIEGGKKTYFFIFEIDDDKPNSEVNFLGGPKPNNPGEKMGNTLLYNGKVWINFRAGKKTMYYFISGRQWQKREQKRIEAVENDTSKYITNSWIISVTETRYYYFIVKTLYSCEVSLDGKELMKSNRCKKGSKCSSKLEAGIEYQLKLTYSNNDVENYFAWSNKYGRNWIDDLTDDSVIKFHLI